MANDSNVPVSTKHFDKKTGQPFKLGLIPTPPEKLAQVERFQAESRAEIPLAVAFYPKLQMWGNNQYGDCVSAQEAFAKACCGVQLTDDELIAWAGQHNLLNGANLTDVMDLLKSSPFSVGSHNYGDGPYQSVDFTNEDAVVAAIAQNKAPLNIAIDHTALSSDAGNQMAWSSVNVQGKYTNYDHCVAIAGYGPAKILYPLYGGQVPAGMDPEKRVFPLFTWSTIGLVDLSFFQAATSEMYVRNPTTTTDGAPGPDPIVVPNLDPTPTPPPTPVPPTPAPPTPVPVPPSPGLKLPVWVVAIGAAVGLIAGFFIGRAIK